MEALSQSEISQGKHQVDFQRCKPRWQKMRTIIFFQVMKGQLHILDIDFCEPFFLAFAVSAQDLYRPNRTVPNIACLIIADVILINRYIKFQIYPR